MFSSGVLYSSISVGMQSAAGPISLRKKRGHSVILVVNLESEKRGGQVMNRIIYCEDSCCRVVGERVLSSRILTIAEAVFPDSGR